MGTLMVMDRQFIEVEHPFFPGQEQEFKTEMLRVKRIVHPDSTFFEIENEEKEPGFPDTLEIGEGHQAKLVEYKVSDEHGNIKFERDQPLFYKRHRFLDIEIIAYCVPDNKLRTLLPWQILDALTIRVSRGQRGRMVNIKNGEVQ
jgi:hypothetical protein